MKQLLLTFFLAFATCLALVHADDPTSMVEVHLDVIPNTPRLILSFSLTNPSLEGDALPVLKWGTPIEGVMGPIFQVFDLRRNMPVAYVGKLVRRVWPPLDSSFIHVAPQQTISIDVDLTDEFAFAGAGDYLINYVQPEFTTGVAFGPANSVVGRLPIINRREEERRAPASTNCNANQDRQIDAAVAGATTEAARAYTCMSQRTCDAMAVRWFGPYNQANYVYDQGVFNKVNIRLQSAPFNAYCNPAGCPSDVYAYVYPNDRTYTVYLCGAFWSRPEERVNTVVHEMSHFDLIGGTDDYAYGKTACLNLARSNPTRASHNADNVCYFSEEARLQNY